MLIYIYIYFSPQQVQMMIHIQKEKSQLMLNRCSCFHEKGCTNQTMAFSTSSSGGRVRRAPEISYSCPWLSDKSEALTSPAVCTGQQRRLALGGEHRTVSARWRTGLSAETNWPLAASRPSPQRQFAGMNYLTPNARMASSCYKMLGWYKPICFCS